MSSFQSIFLRGQPFTKGHVHLVEQTFKSVSMKGGLPNILILVGSYNQRKSIKNPFSFEEIKAFIEGAVPALMPYITILPLNDYKYSDPQWILDVQQTVQYFVSIENLNGNNLKFDENVIYGHTKDASSYYMKIFPQWRHVEVANYRAIDATNVRRSWFINKQESVNVDMEKAIPPNVLRALEMRKFDEDLQADWKYYTHTEPETFKDYPFKETLGFGCADAVLECSGNILLVKRMNAPGKGCWALPGGFKNRDETFVQAALRELKEETNVKVADRVLEKNIINTHLFDDVRRSFGIPRHTLAVHIRIDLNPDGSLPKVKASDDAAECRWVPIQEILNEMKMYDDHGDIIMFMTGVTPKPAYFNLTTIH